MGEITKKPIVIQEFGAIIQRDMEFEVRMKKPSTIS
jgi:hypothetical protein